MNYFYSTHDQIFQSNYRVEVKLDGTLSVNKTVVNNTSLSNVISISSAVYTALY